MKHSNFYGFTLIELMITLLIAAIILGIALPSLNSISNEINFSSIQQRLILDITFTRSEAVNQGGGITICASTDSSTCSATFTDWSQGWIIFADNDGDALFTGGTDEIIRASGVDSTATITWGKTNAISFSGDGTTANNSTGNFTICDSRGDTTAVKGITLSQSGRVRSNDSVVCP